MITNLKELFEKLSQQDFVLLSIQDDMIYYRSKEDPLNEVGYEFVYIDDQEITMEDGKFFKLECLHNSYVPLISSDADDIISFLQGIEAAFEANAVYECNSSGNEFYKNGYFHIADRLHEDNRKKPVPAKTVERETIVLENGTMITTKKIE